MVELEPGNRAARAKIPGLERACQERMEKLKAETLGKKGDFCLCGLVCMCGVGGARHVGTIVHPPHATPSHAQAS